MKEIIKHSNLSPASFESKHQILNGSEFIILNLIKWHLRESKPITVEDIKTSYWEAFSKDDKILVRRGLNSSWFDIANKFSAEYVGKDHRLVRVRAVQWFKNNLAGCIIKGKIMAIPVIEIDENDATKEERTSVVTQQTMPQGTEAGNKK